MIECCRDGCANRPVVKVQFRPRSGWWHYCAMHAWPLDEEQMLWGARGERGRQVPVLQVERLQ